MRFTFPDGELERWAVLGRVTTSSVGVWLRDPAATSHVARLRVGGQVAAEASLVPDPTHDGVATVDIRLDDARPGEAFEVEVAGMRRAGRFAPPENEPSAFAFGFGSCHQPFEEALLGDELRCHAVAGIYPRMAELLRREHARFLLLIGDQVYSDGVSSASVRARLDRDDVTDAELAEIYRHLYRGYFNEQGFRALQEALPAYLTWDDHDIFDGWGSQLDPQDFDRRLFRAAELAYREYQQLRNPRGRLDAEPPYAYPFWYGDVGFFVTDLRGCRSYQEGRIMGDRQWTMLDEFFAEAGERDTRTVFLATSVPPVHLSPALVAAAAWMPGSKGSDVRDRWDLPAFRHERQALLERCFAWRAARGGRQVVLLGGDVHVGAAFRVQPRRRTGWPRGVIHQWTSSALTTPGGLEHRLTNAIGTTLVNFGERSVVARRQGLDGYNNFGLVRVTPRAEGGHRLRFSLHEYDARGDRLREQFHVEAEPRGVRRLPVSGS